MREGRQVAGGSDRPSSGDVREDAAVEALEEQLDRLDPRTRVALRERVGAQQHRRADDLVGVGRADPAGVRTEQAQLQLLGQLLRDLLGDEAPEAGVDAVGVLVAAVRDALYAKTTKGIVTSSKTANNHLLFTDF